jgi:hypothetical protein
MASVSAAPASELVFCMSLIIVRLSSPRKVHRGKHLREDIRRFAA